MSKKLNLLILTGVVAATSAGIATSLTTGSLAKSSDTTAVKAVAESGEVSTLLDETVYVFTENDGKVRRVISSDWTKTALDTDKYTKVERSDKTTPISLEIKYTLDGKEISAEDLAGKSGKVTIEYNYKNNQKQDGYYVPYAVMTGMILDNEVFSDVEVEGGRLINDGSRMAIAGIALPGIQENLGVAKSEFAVPDSLKITANVKNFELGMTMSLATTEIFEEIDTSSLNTVDDLAGQINKLTDGMEQLMTGSSKLYDGLAELNDKSGALTAGINQLTAGSYELKNGIATVDAGVGDLQNGVNTAAGYLDQLANNSANLNTGASDLLTNYQSALDNSIEALDGTISALETAIALIPDDVAHAEAKATLAAKKTYLSGIKENLATGSTKLSENITPLLTSLGTYTGTVGQISSSIDDELVPGISELKIGTEKLTAGAGSLASGLTELNNSAPALIDGIYQLKNGSGELKDGISKLNNEGIQKMVDAYGDLRAFTNHLQDIVNVARGANKTKFVYRTDEVKK